MFEKRSELQEKIEVYKSKKEAQNIHSRRKSLQMLENEIEIDQEKIASIFESVSTLKIKPERLPFSK
jgi:DNA-binding protein H-NS